MAEKLNANDRCDRDKSERAYVRLVKDGVRGEVILCSHHYQKHEDALVTDGWVVDTDQREELVPVPETQVHA